MGRWLLRTRDKKEQTDRSEGEFLRNTNEGCRSWSCELSCAFAQCFTKLFLLGKVAALGTPELELWPLASMGRRQTPPPPKDFGIWDMGTGGEVGCSCPASCLGQAQDLAEAWWVPLFV